ncbi:MAG: glutathione S-transferase domain-containing protein [Hyphomonadaceae bacterium]|nr:MAG: glutathione S-transferase domain-containing protein [Hyphomonadaceae bacterium]KAF0186962.1 MAG: glutathione S-transferase domain-containing protein [Hyphomonadaceae bacterium]
MQLYYSNTSPFARKTLIALIEKGLAAKTEIISLSPVGEGAAQIQKANPLGKIPVLVTKDGLSIYDSPLICEYVDGLSAENRLIPLDAQSRLEALQTQALADGIMDAAFSMVMEKRRIPIEQSAAWLERWRGAILRSMGAISEPRLDPAHPFDIGQIAIACALGYVEFRLPEIAFPKAEIIDFWAELSQRPSVAQTAPPKD